MPIDLEIFIPEDDSVRLLSLMMEELDYKKLYEAYSPNGRNPAVPPKILFKILVYAYMNDIWSSRKIELACKRGINFMWLLQGFKAADHNTISRFRTGRLEPILDDLFNQFITKLYENNEIEFKNLFIDGTKIEANANKYTFVWKKSVSKNEIKLGESLPAKYKNIIADAGYESEENYVYLEKNNQKSFIKPQNYENMKKKKFKNNIGKRENMIYDEITDTYTCANNKKLKFIATTTRKSKSGYISKIKIYECENCDKCPIKSKCTKAKGNKKLQVSPVFISKRNQSQNNITSDFGILARMNRSIQVKGAFGVIKENHNFRKFLTRGKKNVKVEFTLLALAYNLNKLHNKIQQNRLGVSFYTKAIA